MFIQTEATPNPATLKFLPGRIVLEDNGTAEFRAEEDAGHSPLAQRLFAISGVAGVFLGGDFITVTKADGEWQHLKPAVLGAIMDHYLSGAPAIDDASAEAAGEEFFKPEDAEIVGGDDAVTVVIEFASAERVHEGDHRRLLRHRQRRVRRCGGGGLAASGAMGGDGGVDTIGE